MSLQLVKIVLLVSLLSYSLFARTLTDAYQLYVTGSYKEALATYRAVDSVTPINDAKYGIINTLVALHKYKEALAFTQQFEGDVFRAKEVWILGLRNKKKGAQQLKTTALVGKDRATKVMFLNSGAWGFYGAQNYKEAQVWFEESYALEKTDEAQNGLALAQQGEKSKVIWTGSVYGGPIGYEQSIISDENGKYQYKMGNFFNASTRWDISKKQWVEVSYSRFNASFQPFKYYDSNYPDWDTTITPAPKHQNILYAAYGYKGVGNRPFDLQGAVVIAGSNIMGIGATDMSENGVIGTAYLGHMNHISHFDIGAHWYGTLGDSLQVGQGTADFGVNIGLVKLSVLPTAVWSPLTMEQFNVSDMQYSLRAKVGVRSKHTSTEISGIWGDRIYANESGAQNMVTITLPHKFTATLNFLVAPGAGKVSLFTILRFENYEQMYRIIALGGIAVSL